MSQQEPDRSTVLRRAVAAASGLLLAASAMVAQGTWAIWTPSYTSDKIVHSWVE